MLKKINEINRIYQEAGQLKIERKYEDAVQQYEKILALEPDFVKAYVELGQLYSEQGRLDEAVKIYKEAIC